LIIAGYNSALSELENNTTLYDLFRSKNTQKRVFYCKTSRVVQRRVQNGKMENKAGAQDTNTYLREKVRGQT